MDMCRKATQKIQIQGSLILLISALLFGCSTTESRRIIESDKVEGHHLNYVGLRTTLAIGKFNNRSNYMQGIFTSGTDRLGNQAKTILKTHLQSTNRFSVMDRDNLQQIANEAGLRAAQQQVKGARYVVTGSVTEFGRKVTGDRQFFGILGSGKSQTAYSKVALNIVDVLTSEVVFSAQGAGEYQLDNREVLGFGSTASYDATLNGKVLNLSITEAVNNLVRGVESGAWKPVE